jgi:hypothetical protein
MLNVYILIVDKQDLINYALIEIFLSKLNNYDEKLNYQSSFVQLELHLNILITHF